MSSRRVRHCGRPRVMDSRCLGSRGVRPAATLYNPNMLADYLVMSIFMALSLLAEVRRRVAVAATAVAVLLLTGVIALAVVLRQPVPVAVRAVRIPVVDGPRDNQRVVLDASFFTPAGKGRVRTVPAAACRRSPRATAGGPSSGWSPAP